MVQNLVRAVTKKTMIKLSGNEVLNIDDSDDYNSVKLQKQRKNASFDRNTLKLRVGSHNAFGSRICIPLDFELLGLLRVLLSVCIPGPTRV